jgi:galactose mutarotase-like enzyme
MTDGPVQAVTLENAAARVVVLPEVGGMISEFVHKASGRDLLFHHPRLTPRPAYYRAPVDDWWAGGVIEALPTGFACTVNGQPLPDFGEVWPEPWAVTASSAAAATLTCTTRIFPLRLTREMSLREGAPCLRMRHTIENLSSDPLQFIWGIHPTVPVGPDTLIQLSARIEEIQIPDGGTNGSSKPLRSAFADGPVPFTEIAEPGQRFSYLSDVPDPAWFAVWDRQWKVGLGMTFSGVDFPCLWLWLLDGWRGLRAITVEPWTGWPGALDQAIQLGRAHTLAGRGRFATVTSLIAFGSTGPLRGFDPDGIPLLA